MSPTHTITSPEPHATGLSPLPSPTNSSVFSGYFQRSPSPEQHKRSMDSDRSSSSNWRWNNKDSSR
ncbi:hypothetical protein B0T09DRAFT_380945 [Sordaria sp. MPI-SDFR-AT-0083]|nr:hypothetical protein B0T09DRAFT_380945 [Sordaria sp. MPI-SDFR-AT-0083]